jgi:putative heme-binding domain-containing protein
MPPVVDVGIGSPTSIRFGTGTAFPARYQKALFGLDWVFGRLIAVHLQEQGAGYTGRVETLFRGGAMNLTDLEVGPDGALYCITGGRGGQSGLYRLTFVGNPASEPSAAVVAGAKEARAQRRQLEAVHGQATAGWLASGWSQLGSADPMLRQAARIALESQPVATWVEKALAEENPKIGLSALLALARCGDGTQQVALLKALGRWPLDALDEEGFLTQLRVIEVAFARHGIPAALKPMVIEKLGRQFPASTWPRNRELSQLLVALGDGEVVPKILQLRDASKTWQERMHYTAALHGMTQGWTPALRQRYFAGFRQIPSGWGHIPAAYEQWFLDVDQKPNPGAGFDPLIKRLEQKAFALIPDAEKGPIAELMKAPPSAVPAPTVLAATPSRSNGNRVWKFDDLADVLSTPLSGRNYARGQQVYQLSQCGVCHRFQGAGGATGPELTGVSIRYSRADLWRSIVDPNAVISEQYQSMVLTLKDGKEITGRVLEDSPTQIVVGVDALTDRKVTVQPSEVRHRVVSKVSSMPEGLLSAWGREDILDLLGYLESNGQEESPIFKRR